LRRHMKMNVNLSVQPIKAVMTKSPTTISKGQLAAEALRILQDRKFDELPVVDAQGKLVGLLDVQDLLKAGLV